MPYFTNRGIVPLPAGGGPYEGPGDSGLMGTARFFVGLRAYTLASIGANAIRLRESGGNTEQTFVTITGGGLDLAAITTFKGANNLFVKTLFDQTGNGVDFTQATNANQPAFTLGAIGSLPAITFTAASSHYLATGGLVLSDQNQPFTFSCVAKSNGAGSQTTICTDTANSRFGFNRSGGAVVWSYNGVTVLTGAAADGSFHAFQTLFNSTSSDNYVDGTPNTGDLGATNFFAMSGGNVLYLGSQSGSSEFHDGQFMELGLWSGDKSSDFSDMNTNQHTYFGF